MNRPDAAAWTRRIAAILDDMESVQTDFRSLHAIKRDAFRAADVARIAAAGETETGLVDRLKAVVVGREQLLADARRVGHRAVSLSKLAAELDVDRAIVGRIEKAARDSAKLQREAWAHWVTARRGAAVTGEILERIAHRGREAATYEQAGRDATAGQGGSFLDAAA